MNKYIHGRTCVYNINYHIVWCVKYRKKVLSADISNRLYELINDIGSEKGFSVVTCKVGDNDHVRSVRSYNGHLQYGHTWKLRKHIYNYLVLTRGIKGDEHYEEKI